MIDVFCNILLKNVKMPALWAPKMRWGSMCPLRPPPSLAAPPHGYDSFFSRFSSVSEIFNSTHDSQCLYKNWFKSAHDSKWISEILFKSSHDSKSFQHILIQINSGHKTYQTFDSDRFMTQKTFCYTYWFESSCHSMIRINCWFRCPFLGFQ